MQVNNYTYSVSFELNMDESHLDEMSNTFVALIGIYFTTFEHKFGFL